MVILDTALEKLHEEGRSIKVGIVGAGFMARGIILQINKFVKGMEVVAIANRTLDNAYLAFHNCDIEDVENVDNVASLEDNIQKGKYSITNNYELLCEAEGLDAIVEATGAVELCAKITLSCIHNNKHIILMNAETDGTVGPILKHYADQKGVVFTNVDGDQPGVIMNLYRYVKSLGLKPVLCGNIKGLHDPYRNPTTQANYAKIWGQNPAMVTSFADGTKISFEQAIVANSTSMQVGKRGMYGPTVPAGTPIQEVIDLYPIEKMMEGNGIVDYVVGAAPGPGVFVVGYLTNPVQKHYLKYYKMGDGPLYCFYTPYHLCHFEVHHTIGRAVLYNDPTIAPVKPMVDVVATAKKDLKPGEVLDGIGHYMTYGICENNSVVLQENLLPMGLAMGCKLKHSVIKDQVLTYDDVEIPAGRIIDELRLEQNAFFAEIEVPDKVHV